MSKPDQTKPSIATIRALYGAVRARACDTHGIPARTFDRDVRACLDPAEMTPALWLKVAQRIRHGCPDCSGTGKYRREGCEPGICYRCGGKGAQNDEDRRRNWGYDHRTTTHDTHDSRETDDTRETEHEGMTRRDTCPHCNHRLD